MTIAERYHSAQGNSDPTRHARENDTRGDAGSAGGGFGRSSGPASPILRDVWHALRCWFELRGMFWGPQP